MRIFHKHAAASSMFLAAWGNTFDPDWAEQALDEVSCEIRYLGTILSGDPKHPFAMANTEFQTTNNRCCGGLHDESQIRKYGGLIAAPTTPASLIPVFRGQTGRRLQYRRLPRRPAVGCMSNLTGRPVVPKFLKRSRKDRIRKSTQWASAYGTDEEFQAFVRKLLSALSGNGPCNFAHYRTAANPGTGCNRSTAASFHARRALHPASDRPVQLHAPRVVGGAG